MTPPAIEAYMPAPVNASEPLRGIGVDKAGGMGSPAKWRRAASLFRVECAPRPPSVRQIAEVVGGLRQKAVPRCVSTLRLPSQNSKASLLKSRAGERLMFSILKLRLFATITVQHIGVIVLQGQLPQTVQTVPFAGPSVGQ